MMELTAGARSVRDRRFLRTFFSAFRRAGRILLPTAAVFDEAGEVLRRLRERGHGMGGACSLSNDVLITLSARSIGAVVITQNRTDFEAIRAIRPFLLVIV